MRSYIDIIIDLEDGKKVDYEEARLAALAGSYMMQGIERDIEKLTGFGTEKQKDDMKSIFAIKNYEIRFKSRKMPVDKYLGSWHPDSLGRQKEREMHKRIFDKFTKQYDSSKWAGWRRGLAVLEECEVK